MRKKKISTTVDKDNKTEFEIIGGAISMHLLEKVYPISIGLNNRTENFEGGHFIEQRYAKDLCDNTYSNSNIANTYFQCKAGKLSARSGEGSCKMCDHVEITEILDIDIH
ncbi:hypothetical protein BCR36DRAFT_190235 [Piromyces finnis]|uniref:Uncharacterized protein n=1 Tax=Piromyces finnis TaxID=1754191 RepID=A0A1Y1UQS9_9FUNG|nr:hypothetical protein BCR36DRAFT_190235 [Piromyces finnis]|eukprot:ORX40401.1 hypothetical protein BCR36DRAFT_190235 [Piromyces finnis]